MPTLLDANAVLRYLLEDDPSKAEAVEKAIAAGAEVTVEVLAACVCVLERACRMPRWLVAVELCQLLDEVSCARRSVALVALELYGVSGLSFGDCVLAAEHDEDEARRECLVLDMKHAGLVDRLDD